MYSDRDVVGFSGWILFLVVVRVVLVFLKMFYVICNIQYNIPYYFARFLQKRAGYFTACVNMM